MADTAIAITAGTGTSVDTRTEGTNGNHRQVVVLGDPSTNAGVAPVDATKGLAVDLTATGSNTNALKVDGSAVTQPVSGTVTITPSGTQTVSGTVAATQSGTWTVQPGNTANTTAWKVDGSAVTQPVSAASLPLPSLAATSTKQSDGTQKTQVVDGSGNVIGATSNALDVNIKSGASSGAVAQGSTTSGQTGSLVQGAVTTAAPSYTTAQTNPLSLTTAGALRVDGSAVTQPVSLASVPSHAVTNAGTFAVQATPVTQADTFMLGGVNVKEINAVTPLMGNGTTGTGSQRVTIASDNTAVATWGQGATGSAVPSGAEYEAGIAKTALPSAATDGNLTGIMTDKFGRQVNIPVTIRDLVGTQTTTLSASTSETTIVTAGGAGVFNDLVMLIVSNTSASTNTRIDFRDVTAGSVLFSLFSVGGAAPVGFALPVPIPQTTANTAWTAQCATSTTDVRIYAVFAKQK